MDRETRRRLDHARRVLEANRGGEHDHRGPSPCPICGGTPLDTAVQHYRKPKLIDRDDSDSEENDE